MKQKNNLYIKLLSLLGLGVFFILLFISCSCSMTAYTQKGVPVFKSKRTDGAIHIISWNLQTFFDGETLGTEYDEFKGSKSVWNQDKYKDRLIQLCTLIQKENADIYVFQEIENKSILYDISNQLQCQYKGQSSWGYASLGTEVGGALGVAVLSKLVLKESKTHQLIIDTEDNQPQMRPVLETIVESPNGDFTLFACHWKSKSGDTENTAIWRKYQEGLLVNRISKCCTENRFILCGDFNQGIQEFSGGLSNSFITFNSNPFSPSLEIQLFSPWNRSEYQGSYCFKNKWDTIDHFFAGSELEIVSFEVLEKKPYIDETGLPYRYDMWLNQGLSDHLPISCFIKL